jgi:hypothetical protein
MKENSGMDFQALTETMHSNRTLKMILYIGIGVIALYLFGKACKGLAETVRGFNDLKSAINGN